MASRSWASRATCRGFWVAEAVWITHSAGVARAMAEWLVEGSPRVDVHEMDLTASSRTSAGPAYVEARGRQNYIEVYDIIHPLQPMEQPRPLRTSPFYPRQVELGARFLEGGGWERPHWYEANAALPGVADVPGRGEWASALLVADRGRGGTGNPGRRRALRPDAAHADRGHGPRRGGLPAADDHQRRRPAAGHGRLHA